MPLAGLDWRLTSGSERVPQLELDPARRVALLRQLAEVRAVDIGARQIPLHGIQRVDEVQPEFQVRLFGRSETASDIGIELRQPWAPQPVQSRREDAAMERIRLEIGRGDRGVGLAWRQHVFGHQLADARFPHGPIARAEITRCAGEELPVEPRIGTAGVAVESDVAQVVAY